MKKYNLMCAVLSLIATTSFIINANAMNSVPNVEQEKDSNEGQKKDSNANQKQVQNYTACLLFKGETVGKIICDAQNKTNFLKICDMNDQDMTYLEMYLVTPEKKFYKISADISAIEYDLKRLHKIDYNMGVIVLNKIEECSDPGVNVPTLKTSGNITLQRKNTNIQQQKKGIIGSSQTGNIYFDNIILKKMNEEYFNILNVLNFHVSDTIKTGTYTKTIKKQSGVFSTLILVLNKYTDSQNKTSSQEYQYEIENLQQEIKKIESEVDFLNAMLLHCNKATQPHDVDIAFNLFAFFMTNTKDIFEKVISRINSMSENLRANEEVNNLLEKIRTANNSWQNILDLMSKLRINKRNK